MLKRISAVLAVAALPVLALATPAGAVPLTVTNRTATFSCTSGGSTFTLTQRYKADNVGTGAITLDEHTWSSSPAAQFDRITFSLLDGSGNPYTLLYAMGGTSSSQNDVPSSGGSSAENGIGATVYAPGTPKFRVSVYGGVGNSTATCSDTANVIGV